MSSNDASAGAELRIICGPTAAGKSAIAMALAERHGLTIISADSRQIYRGFDVGTAKPTAKEQQRVSHRGIEVADPTERWSAARWARDATEWIAAAGADRAIVVGGTGLYLKALVRPLADAPPVDAAARDALESELELLDTDTLRARCKLRDPALAHLGRAQLLRAIIVAELTGTRLSDAQREDRPSRRVRWLVVDPGERLHPQIVHRLDRMLAGPWQDEVRRLMQAVPADAPAWQGCGYDAVRDIVTGTTDLGRARETILIETRQYAKRQRTWFRHQIGTADVTRIDPHDPRADALVQDWWERPEDA
jgi:tRNA dimethylallyltransferase